MLTWLPATPNGGRVERVALAPLCLYSHAMAAGVCRC